MDETDPQPGVENDPEDDLSNRYLLGRQVAHEYNSLAVQSILQSGPERFDTSPEGMRRQEQYNKKPARQADFERMQAGQGVPPQETAAEMEGLQTPDVDPVMAAAGGAAGAFKLSYGAFNALVPSFAKAAAAGAVSAGTEFPLGTASAIVAKDHPGLAVPFSIAAGMLSGSTIERAMERGIVKAAQKAGAKLTESDFAISLMRNRRALAHEPEELTKDLSRVVNPIEPSLSREEKVQKLIELSRENDPIVNKALGEIDSQLGTASKSSFKAPENIASKAQRPSILEEKPWHDVEHVRDSYRFKTVVDDISQIPQAVELLVEKTGAQVIKFDVEKLREPMEWGWRIASFDMRMPNGQLVEYYIPIREMESAKKAGNHGLFEKWRNTSAEERISNPQYNRDKLESYANYQAGWEAARSRLGSDETAADASLKNIEEWASSARRKLSLKSSAEGASLRQTPSLPLTTENASHPANTRPSSAIDTSLKSDMESPPDANRIAQRRNEINSVIEEINTEIGNRTVGDFRRILMNQRGELQLPGGRSAGSGVPTPPTPPHEVMQREAVNIVAEAEAGAAPQLRKYAGNINLDRIDSPDAVKAIIDGNATLFETEFETARRGTQTWDMTEKEAKNYTLDDLLGRKSGQAYNAGQIENARQLLVTSATNVKGLAEKVRSGLANDFDKFEFARAVNQHYAIQSQVAGAAAEAGRALQIFNRVAKNDTIRLSEIKDYLAATNSPVTIAKMAEAISAMRTPAQVAAFIPKAMRATTKDMFLEAWINGLLSGPQTHATNMLSNALTAVTQIPERMLASQIGRFRGSAREITEGEVVAQAWGLVQGMKDGLKLAFKALKSGESSDIMGKIETRSHRSITAENMRQLPIIEKLAPNALQQGGMAARGVDFLGEVVRAPGRALMAEDEFFKSVGYRMELNARAYRKAHVEEGLAGTDAAERINAIMRDPETFAPDVHLAAVDAARYQTFTSKLDSKVLSGLAGSNNPFVRIVVPFVSTPTNILRYMGARTPAAFLMRSVRDDIAAGGARADLALARIAAGSMVAGVAVAGVASGTITGSGPSDPKMRQYKINQGWQPDSIKIGDKYYSYGRLEPIGGLLGIAASAAEIMGEIDEDERRSVAAAVAGAFGKYATSRTWLRGVSELVEALDDPDRYGDKYLQKLLGTVVPTGVAQIERTLSPELKQVNDYIDAVKARIPGWSEEMPRRRNIWGEPITLGGGLGPDIVSPIYTSKAKESPIDKDLLDNRIPISMPRRVQTFEKMPVELTPEQYEKFLVTMNKTPLQSTGKPLKDSLNDLVTKDSYYKSTKDKDHKEMMIKAQIREATIIAKDIMLRGDPGLRRVVTALQEQKMSSQDLQ